MNEEQPNEKNAPPSKQREVWKTIGLVTLKTIKWLFILGIIVGLFAGGAVAGYVASFVKDEPIRTGAEIEEKMGENAITGFVYFSDGTQIGQLRTEEDRRLIQWEEIPDLVKNAVLAIEDNNFNEHPGVDVNALLRAVKQKLLNEPVQTGGSTLTQQLVRRVFLSLDKTDSRKVKEIFLSLRLERYMSKNQIFTAYLNKVPFGNGSTGYNLYGIKAAAKGIFNIDDLNKLNVAQAAYLAGLPQLPSRYSAFNGKGEFEEKGFKRAMERQSLVLKRMLQEQKITQQQYDDALKFDLKSSLAAPNKKAYNTYPYLMLEAERQAAEILLMQKDPKLTPADMRKKEYSDAIQDAREHLLRAGYKIHMTIDKTIYDSMHVVSSNADNFAKDDKVKGVEQTAAVMIDNRTGAILGMIEGRDFNIEQMNYATQMLRQPGSAMKPLGAYLPALEKGLVQPGTTVDDAPIVLKDGSKGFHIPKNSTNDYKGLVTAREALNRSLNLPALKLFNYDVGIAEAWSFVRKLGITSLQKQDDHAQTGVIGGLSLGTSVEELTNAYSTIPNKGVFKDSYMIDRIEDSEGNIIFKHEQQPETVYSEQTAYLMTDMLRTVISGTGGTASKLRSQFKHYKSVPIAGKTGTTQNYGDVWFVGFTPDVTLGVWTGYEKPVNTLSKPSRDHAKSIWAQVMDAAIEKKPELFATKTFEKPKNIVSMTVSSVSGKLPSELTKQTGRLVTDIFNKKYIPTEEDDALVNMSYVTYNGVNYIPNPSTPADMVKQQIMVKRKRPIQEVLEEIKAAQQKMSSKDIKALARYIPPDAKMDAPTQDDPRTDDGATPAPPGSLKIEPVGSAVRIVFAASSSPDVVGYRMYRSVNGGAYTKDGGSVLTGDELKFVNYISTNNMYSYYITAVDVAGNESAPSASISTDGTGGNVPSGPGTSPGDGQTPPAGEGGQTDGQGNGQTILPSSPTQVSVSSRDLGLKIVWNANPQNEGVTSYTVYFSDTENGEYKKIDTVNSNAFEYISLSLTGWYRVTALNGVGESPPSAAVHFQE